MDQTVDRISPTALLIAHLRSITDIPFAAEVARLTKAREASLELLGGNDATLSELARENAPQSEARYKCITSAIIRSGVSQVLELGCGISMRGLAMTADPSLRYVATDLPGIVQANRDLLAAPELGTLLETRNLIIEPLDVLSSDAFDAVARHFDPAPLAVVCEGLLNYFTRDEVASVARSIKLLLARAGGVWITPDLVTRAQLVRDDAPATRDAHATIEQTTQRSFVDNAFADLADLQAFCDGLGLSFETHPQLDGSFALSSLEPLGLEPNHVERFRELELRTLRLR